MGLWPLAALVVIGGLAGLPLLTADFQVDPAYALGYVVGTIATAMLFGLLGLLVRRRPGLWFFIISVGVYLLSQLGQYTASLV